MALSLCNSTTALYGQESLRYADPAFPIACFSDDLSAMEVPWHWHEEWECVFVAAGQAEARLPHASLRLRAGEGLFVNAGTLHAFDRAAAVLHSAVFHPRLVGGGTESVYWRELVLPFLSPPAPPYLLLAPPALSEFHAAWQAAVDESEDHANLVRYLLSRLMRGASLHAGEARKVSPQERVDAERMRAMLAFIEAHLSEELSSAAIAASVNISESVALRCFHRTLGVPPLQYVKRIRLARAAEMLLSTAMPVQSVALACGFRDAGYFIKAFRARMGCTPGEYRRRP